MAYPSLLHPEPLPLWQSTDDPHLHRRCSNTVLSQSLWGPWVLVHTRFVWALSASLLGMRFDSKREFPLLPPCWGFSFALGRGVSPHSCCSTYRLTGDSLTLDVGYLLMTGPAKYSRRPWPWTWGISSWPPLLTLDMGYLLSTQNCDQ